MAPTTTTNTYSTLLILAGMTCLMVAGIIWQQRRDAHGAKALIGLMLALGWWDITYAFFWAGAPGPNPLFWLDMTYLGVVAAPPLIFLFALQIAARSDWQRPFPLGILWIMPTLTLVMLWTDPWHGLFFAGERSIESAMIQDGGPIFWANLVYSYSLVLLAIGLLLQFFIRSQGIYRRQAAFVLGSIVIAWLNSVLFITRLSPLPNTDNTPFVFSFAAVGFAFALLRYRLFDVVPIARDALIEHMSDGIIVLDNQHRVLDINPAARTMIEGVANVPIGMRADGFDPTWNALVSLPSDSKRPHTEIMIEGDPPRFLDVRATTLRDRQQQIVGRLVVCRDITELKHAQAELQHLATTDGLTQIANRRFFLSQAAYELQHAQRLGHTLALIMLDIDHFKRINDTYGHAVGDKVLIHFVQICREQIRENELLARMGGEEFVVLLRQANLKEAIQVAERLRNAVKQAVIEIQGYRIAITMSLGVTALSAHTTNLEQLLQHADQALYIAKESGRNQIQVWTALPDQLPIEHR